MSITGAIIPGQVNNDCVDVQTVKQTSDSQSSDSFPKEFNSLFPAGATAVPLTGGAVVSFNASALKLEPSDNVNNIIKRNLSSLLDLQLNNTLVDINKAHLAVSKGLFDIAKRNLQVINEDKSKRLAPSLFISIFRGTNSSSLKDDTPSSDMVQLVELRFLPKEALVDAISNVNANSPDFKENAIGVAGKTFETLESGANSLNEISITDLVLELFPVVNVSEDVLNSVQSNPIIGGYYTLHDGIIYTKLPDLSGRNSAGQSSELITADTELFFEFSSSGKLTRTPLNFTPPVIASFVGNSPDDLPAADGSLIIEMESNLESANVYLSIVNTDADVSNQKRINEFSGGTELFSVPLLTKGIEDGREATLNESSTPEFNQALFEENLDTITKFIPGFTTPSNIDGVGFPYLGGNNDAGVFFGEKNRPEVILTDPSSTTSNKSNDNKYFNLGTYGVIEILASIRPNIYNFVPSEWLQAKAKRNSDGNLEVEFPGNNFSDFNLGASGSVTYSVYVGDDSGQITRVSGPLMVLSEPRPAITSIVPNGYADSIPIDINDLPDFTIEGEDLGRVQQVNFTSSAGTNLSFSIDESSRTDSIIRLTLADSFLDNNFVSDQAYTVTLEGSNSQRDSNTASVYITSDITAELPLSEPVLPEFKDDELSSSEFGDNSVVGVPVLGFGKSAQIGIKSSSKLFKENSSLFAYLAVEVGEQDTLSSISLSDQIKTFSSQSNGILAVASNIEYTFENSPFADFARVSNRKAVLNFPGNKFAAYNFEALKELSKAYILVSNTRVIELAGSNNSFLLPFDDYDVIELGSDAPPFIDPYTVLGVAIDAGADTVPSSFAETDFVFPSESSPKTIFGGKDLAPGSLSVFGTINKMMVLVSGVNEKRLQRRYTFKLGTEDITNKISAEPVLIDNKTISFVFENITLNTSGVLSVIVEKDDKIFGISTTTANVVRPSTLAIRGDVEDLYSIAETGLLTLNEASADTAVLNMSELLGSTKNISLIGSVSPTMNLLDIMYPELRSGLLFDKMSTNELEYYTLSPISITSSTTIRLNIDGEDITLGSGFPQEDVRVLGRSTLTVPSGALFSSGSYIQDGSNNVLAFFNTNVTSPAAFKYNVAEVIGISVNSGEIKPLTEEFKFIAGIPYFIKVKSDDPNFIIKLGDLELKPSSGKAEPTGNPFEYIVTVTPTDEIVTLTSTAATIDICASTSNSQRNRAKFSLGRDFVIDIAQNMEGLLDGVLKDSIPDVQGLLEEIQNFPLRLASIEIDTSLVSVDEIKSFCDFSFNLVAELKIALNGFSIMMVPIQVIFCIIDVICALLNPIKLARAVIRLFQCLYDLVLLIPAISVPVMFLQLVLHLIRLLICFIDKILFTITVINEIINAINSSGTFYDGVKNLEEILSEYLFSIEADLQILAPVLSVLAVFLELLQLIFRFPCQIDPAAGEPDCGVDGTLLGGIVAGIAAPDLVMLPDNLLPVGQVYTTDSDTGSTASGLIEEPTVDDVIAVQSSTDTYLDSMSVDADSLRGTVADTSNKIDFDATFAPTFTKSKKKGGGTPGTVEFKFNGRGLSNVLNSKNIDPNQTVDTSLAFLSQDNDELKIAENGNIYSPIDGEAFLSVSGDKASVLPLVLELEVPVIGPDPETGEATQIGTELVTRTFNEIPKMAILDDEFNLYFIEEDGIEFDNDGFVNSIRARIVNNISAPKLRFTKEDQEIDTDDDGDVDAELKVFDFPQLYFFDMRQASEQIEQFCSQASINSFVFDSADTTDTEEVTNIVSDTQQCVQEYIDGINGLTASIREAQTAGVLPLPTIDINEFNSLNDTVNACVSQAADEMCRFVVNSLNTSFKIEEDDDDTPLPLVTDGELPDSVLDGFESLGSSFTGAREYANGIGDSVPIPANSSATITIIPRDGYDKEIIADLTDKISLSITKDDTGNASFIQNNDGSILTKTGNTYTAKLTSAAEGEVQIKADICSRVVQALTFQGLEFDEELETDELINCIPNTISEITGASPPIGSLIKIDRILSVFFTKPASSAVVVAQGTDGLGAGANPITEPQIFGTKLEN